MTKPRDLATLGAGFIQPGTGSANIALLGWPSADAEEFTAALAAGYLDDIYTLS